MALEKSSLAYATMLLPLAVTIIDMILLLNKAAPVYPNSVTDSSDLGSNYLLLFPSSSVATNLHFMSWMFLEGAQF